MATPETIVLQGTADWHRNEDWRQLMGTYQLNAKSGLWESTHQFESDGETQRGYISRLHKDSEGASNGSGSELGRWFVWFPSVDFVGDTRWAYYRTSVPCEDLRDALGGTSGVVWERNDGEGLDERTEMPIVKWVSDPEMKVSAEPPVKGVPAATSGAVVATPSKTAASGTNLAAAERSSNESMDTEKSGSLAQRVFGKHGSNTRSEMECHVAMTSAVRTHARLLRESAADQLPMDPEDLHAMHHQALLGALRDYLEPAPNLTPLDVAAAVELLQSAGNHHSDLAETNRSRAAATSQLAADELLLANAAGDSSAKAAAGNGGESAGKFVAERMKQVANQLAKVARRPASDAVLSNLLGGTAQNVVATMVAERDTACATANAVAREALDQAEEAEAELAALQATASKAEARAEEAEIKVAALQASLNSRGDSDRNSGGASQTGMESAVAELTRQLAESELSALRSSDQLELVTAELQEVKDHLDDEIAHRKELDELQKQMRMQQKAAKSPANQSRIPRRSGSSPRSSRSPSSSDNTAGAGDEEVSKLRAEVERERGLHNDTQKKLEAANEHLRLLESEIATLESDYRERLKAQQRRGPKNGIPGVREGSRQSEGGVSPDELEAAVSAAKAAATKEAVDAHAIALASAAAESNFELNEKETQVRQLEADLLSAITDLKVERTEKDRFREREAALLDHLDQVTQQGKQEQDSIVVDLTAQIEDLKSALARAEDAVVEQTDSNASVEEAMARVKVREQQLEEWLAKAKKEYEARHDDFARKEEEGVGANQRYQKKLSETKTSVKRFMQAVEEQHHSDKSHLATLLATAHSTNASEHGTFATHLDTLALDIDAMDKSVQQLEESFVSSNAAEIKHSKTMGSFLTIKALTKRSQKQHETVRALEDTIQGEAERNAELAQKRNELEQKLQGTESELETTQIDLKKLRTVAEDREVKLGEVEKKLAAKEARVSKLQERTSEVQIELEKRDEALAKERALVCELQRRLDSNNSNFSGGVHGYEFNFEGRNGAEDVNGNYGNDGDDDDDDEDEDDDDHDDHDDDISMRELELEEPASDGQIQEEERKGEETDVEDKSYDSPGESSAYIAAFDFEADPNDPNQMVLAPGDELCNVKELGGGWSKGTKSRTMQRGVFPTAFILPVEALLSTEVSSPPDYGASNTRLDDQGEHTKAYGDDSSHMVPVEMDSDTDSAQPSQGSVTGSLKLKPLRRPGKKEATTPQKRRALRSLGTKKSP